MSRVRPCAKVSHRTDQRAIGAVVARFVHTEEVTGSNPVSPTERAAARMAVVARLCRSHRRGHWFEPSIAHPRSRGGRDRSRSAASAVMTHSRRSRWLGPRARCREELSAVEAVRAHRLCPVRHRDVGERFGANLFAARDELGTSAPGSLLHRRVRRWYPRSTTAIAVRAHHGATTGQLDRSPAGSSGKLPARGFPGMPATCRTARSCGASHHWSPRGAELDASLEHAACSQPWLRRWCAPHCRGRHETQQLSAPSERRRLRRTQARAGVRMPQRYSTPTHRLHTGTPALGPGDWTAAS